MSLKVTNYAVFTCAAFPSTNMTYITGIMGNIL